MKIWQFLKAGGDTLLALSVGAQAWKHPGDDEAHIHQEQENGADPQIGRGAIQVAVTSIASAYVYALPPGWTVVRKSGVKKSYLITEWMADRRGQLWPLQASIFKLMAPASSSVDATPE